MIVRKEDKKGPKRKKKKPYEGSYEVDAYRELPLDQNPVQEGAKIYFAILGYDRGK